MKLSPPPPQNWQDFEDLVVDVAKLEYPAATEVTAFGRAGQDQSGIDVVVDHPSGLVGIQAKSRRLYTANGRLRTNGDFEPKDLDEMIREADAFHPKLSTLIIATTVLRDTALQAHLLKVNGVRQKSQSARVAIWFWEDFIIHLLRNGHLYLKYWENVLRKIPGFSPERMLLEVVRDAFQRPAFMTPIHSENNGDHLLQAIKDTQETLATGVQRNRETRTILQQAPLGYSGLTDVNLRKFLETAWHRLQDARNLYTQALGRSGQWGPVIDQRGDFLEIRDPQVARGLDRFRQESVDAVNEALKTLGLQQLIVRQW